MFANNRINSVEDMLISILESHKCESIQICSSYLSLSGAKRIIGICKRFRVNEIYGYFGLSVPHTQNSALVEFSKSAEVNVVRNYDLWFHPKVIRINKTDASISAIIGSANLTNGGLNSNTEFCTLVNPLGKSKTEFEKCWNSTLAGMSELTKELLIEHKDIESNYNKILPKQKRQSSKIKKSQTKSCVLIFNGAIYGRGAYSIDDKEKFSLSILKGSKLRPAQKTQALKSIAYSKGLRDLYTEFIDHRSWKFKVDTPPMAVSAAASIITGVNENGYFDWIDSETGQNLDEIRKESSKSK